MGNNHAGLLFYRLIGDEVRIIEGDGALGAVHRPHGVEGHILAEGEGLTRVIDMTGAIRLSVPGKELLCRIGMDGHGVGNAEEFSFQFRIDRLDVEILLLRQRSRSTRAIKCVETHRQVVPIRCVKMLADDAAAQRFKSRFRREGGDRRGAFIRQLIVPAFQGEAHAVKGYGLRHTVKGKRIGVIMKTFLRFI